MAAAEGPAEAAVELCGLPPDGGDELLTLYFENRRRSGGGPLRSWRRLGGGGVLTFRDPADAARVLAREHELQGVRLRLRPAPPRAPARLLLQGLPPGAAPRSLELHVQALLRAAGLPEQPCRALDSPRPDRALVQLARPLSEAELLGLEELASSLRLEGAAVALTAVPQARAVRVVRAMPPVDALLLELYLENQGRSGGGALEGLRSLPGLLGTVVSFQDWQVAERVLQRKHELQGTVLSLVPHYDVLEPEDTAEDIGAGGHLTEGEPAVPKPATPEAGRPAEVPVGAGTVPMGSEQVPGPPATPAPVCLAGPPALPGPVGSVGVPGREGPGHPGPEVSPGQGGLVDVVLPVEPGALRFLRLYHEDLLADLGDVALFPLEGSTVTGFRLCGELGPCRAAEEFLQCLLGSVGCHLLSLSHPGSASFLLSAEGQQLLRELEARFRCAFGTERLATAALEATESTAEDPTEALQALPGQPLTPWPLDNAGSDQENVSLGEMRELLAALDSGPPLERGEETPGGRPEEAPETSSPAGPGRLEEEAELQLALHRSLELPGREAKQEETAALQRALALSLLEPPPPGAVGLPGGGPGSQATLEVHAAFEQDVEELERELGAALEEHLKEEAVGPGGHLLPAELRARLERFHGVSVALRGDCTVLRGFGAQPARAARHLAALLAGAPAQSPALPAEAPVLRQRLKEPPGGLECLAEDGGEFREVVQAFYDTLDDTRSRVRIIRVQRVRHPLLQQQYAAHLGLLEQRCQRRPVERVLYHGTSAAAVPDICAHGFNRSFCGRNGTLYGQGVYFAERASLSVQDCYSPPTADGHKRVFVARVLTGDFGQGHPGLRAPPLRAADDALLRFDSAVDSLDRPRIFVIFHDTQALPTHLITCQRLPRAPPSGPSGPAAAAGP